MAEYVFVRVSGDRYVAPRVGSVPRNGRVVRAAACGHDVFLSPRGVEAVDVEGKRLMCVRCMEAVAAEAGAELAVWSGG